MIADAGDRTIPHAWTDLGLLVRHDQGGNEIWQLSLLGDDGRLRRLTRDPNAIHQSVTLHPDRRRVGLGWNPGGQGDVVLGELDLDSGALSAWATPGQYWSWGAWSPDGERAWVVKLMGSWSEGYILERSGRLTRALPDARRVEQVEWTESGIYVCTDAGGRDFIGLARVDPAHPEVVDRWLLAPDHDVEGFALDHAGKRAAVVLNEGVYDGVHIVDLGSGQVIDKVQLEPGVVIHDHSGLHGYHVSWSQDDHSLFVTWEHPDRPAEIYRWPGVRWTAVNRDAEFEGLTRPVELTYKSFDGLPIHCLYYAVGDTPRPAVVHFHGGPEGQSRGEYQPIVHMMNSIGVNVLRPNVRGSSGYGIRFQSLDDKTLRWDSVKDGCEAARHLKREDLATRTAAMGGSYGGFMTLAVNVEDPDLWDAAVDTVGIADWHTFFKNMPPWRGVLRMSEYGDPNGAEADFLREASPLRRAHLIKAPLLILHGRNDPRVPVQESEQIAEKAANAEIIVFDDEGHGIVRLDNQVTANSRILSFLKDKLQA
jgi:dipeptidyl aminopeptidase/acylaminoacyl peptidase